MISLVELGDPSSAPLKCTSDGTTETTHVPDKTVFGIVNDDISSHGAEAKPHNTEAKSDEYSEIKYKGSHATGDGSGAIYLPLYVLVSGAPAVRETVEEARTVRSQQPKQREAPYP